MNALQPLMTLLGQAESERDAAQAQHLKAQTAHQSAQAQAEQLLTYRREYEQRWSAQFCREGRIELVHCYQSFMERLTLAMDQQARIAQHAAQLAERAMLALREAEMRCASVRKLIERRVVEQRVAADRRDQKQTDESATRAAWRRIGSTRPAPLM